MKILTSRELQALFLFVVISIFGAVLASGFDLQGFKDADLYHHFLYALLGIGLYASVYGIDLDEVRQNTPLIMKVVTIGVVLKIALIGSLFYLVLGSPLAYVYAIVIAQIDPLSVSALTSNRAGVLSKKTKNLLLAWASFDDPITVIAAVVVMSFILVEGQGQLLNVALLLGNLILPAGVYLLHKHLSFSRMAELMLLGVVFAASVYFELMLAVALTALFLRPRFPFDLDHLVRGAYFLAVVVMGTYLIEGLHLYLSFILAAIAFAAQFCVAVIFTRKMPRKDMLLLGCAQQNGITAVILALALAAYHEPLVSIIAGAIFFINVMNFASYYGLKRLY